MKILRTDRGGEFIDEEFISFCKKHGIKRELTVRQTPQQNGVAERKNRTIVEMARSMLQSKNLPKYFWTEAVNIACIFLTNPPQKQCQIKRPMRHGSKGSPK